MAMGAAVEHTAQAATPRDREPAEIVIEHHESGGRANRYEEELGMLSGDALVLSRSMDVLFGEDRSASGEAFATIVRLLEHSAATPPSVFGFIAHEAKTFMAPESEVTVGERFRLVHAADGRISVIPPDGVEIILVMGSEGGEKKTKPTEDLSDVPKYALRDPWLTDSAEDGRGGENTVTYEMIMNARGDKEAMTSVLLEMRDDFEGSDAAFNIELRNALERMSDYWGVDSLDCKFGSYRLDDKGHLWVDAPDKKPVRVASLSS